MNVTDLTPKFSPGREESLLHQEQAMKATRHTEEETIGVLKEAEARAKTRQLCRRHGIYGTTFYN